MRSIDTNVLARWVLGDDPAQLPVAEALLAEPVRVSHTVLLELGWVLHKALSLPRETVADMLQQIVGVDTVQLKNRGALAWAIGRFRRGADWGDVMHLVTSSEDADAFATFDRKLAVKAGSESPIVVETLHS